MKPALRSRSSACCSSDLRSASSVPSALRASSSLWAAWAQRHRSPSASLAAIHSRYPVSHIEIFVPLCLPNVSFVCLVILAMGAVSLSIAMVALDVNPCKRAAAALSCGVPNVYTMALERCCVRHLRLSAVVAVLFLAGLVAAGDETDIMFEALFGPRIREAKGTREHEDDLKLAEEMLSTVRNTEISAALTVRICRQAEALVGRLPGGTDLAVESMRLLVKKVPASSAEAHAKISQLLQRAHGAARGDDRKRIAALIVGECEARGDALVRADDWKGAVEQYALAGRHAPEGAARERLKRKYTRAALDMRVEAELAGMVSRVGKNARDRSARDMVAWIYVIHRDSPAEAAKWLADDSSAELRRMVPLAAGKITELRADDCLALGKWYAGMVGRAEESARPVLLVRARRYVRMYLAAGQTDSSSNKAQAEQILKVIEAEFKRLGRADLLTDEEVPAPRADAARPADAGRKDEPVRPTPPRPEGADKVLAVITDSGRTSAWSVTVRDNARIDKNGRMTFNVGAVLTDAGPAIYEACRRSSELTIAATIVPDNDIERGPARIITFSSTGQLRNFTLGQEGQSLVFRLRTSGNGSNGSNHEPKLWTLKARRPARVVVTYARDVINCYVGGRHVMKTDKVRGDFRNWDRKQTMMFGDERDDSRPWHGVVHSVSIYSRALSAEEAIKLSTPR